MKGSKTYKESLFELFTSFVKDTIRDEKFYSNIGKVTVVDESEKTCTVEVTDGPTITDVRLQQVASDTGLLIVPSINSIVIVSWTDKTTAYVSLFSQIDYTIYQNGTNGGLTITPELKTQLDKLTKRVDDIINAIKDGVPVAQDGGVALQATQTVFLDLIVDKEDFSNIENDKFKH